LWRMSRRKELTFKYVMRSTTLGLILFGLGILPIGLIITTIKSVFKIFVLIAYVLVFTYYSIVIYLDFSKSGVIDFKKSLIAASTNGTLVKTFAILVVVYYVIAQIFRMNYWGMAGWIISLIVYLLFFAWSRYYFIEKRG